MTEQWKWATQKRVKEAAEELKELVRTKYPDAQFKLVHAPDSRRGWHLLTMVEGDPHDEIRELVFDRELDLLVEEHVPIFVIALGPDEQARRRRPKQANGKR